MTSRDRTLEFGSIISSLQSPHTNHVRQRPSSRQSDFIASAREIGYDLSCTNAKLDKLTDLAKGRSLFGDPAAEIQELTQEIKQSIGNINNNIAALQQLSKSYRGEGKQSRSHASAVVISLQTKLAELSQGFKKVLEIRTENLKAQKQRREQFSNPLPTSPPSYSNGMAGSSLLLQTEAESRDVSIDMDSLTRERNQMHMLQEQDTYIQERADAMENIHSTIVELGQIFRQLATMVKEQEEQVLRIDANVQETEMNIEAGYGELLKYFKGVTSNRWLMAKIFAVVIIFFIIFIVFLA